MSASVVPDILTMFLCKGYDPSTSTATGILRALIVPQVPAIIPPLVLFVEFTDGRGSVDLDFRLVSDDHPSAAVAHCLQPVIVDEPMRIHQMVLAFHDVRIVDPCSHWLEVTCQGETLARRRVPVIFRPN